MKREFLQLAHTYIPAKHIIKGWIASPKLDGMRAWWDGGYTRGMKISEVIFANRQRDSREHVCTGLWSRYGKPIFAPDEFLDQLPGFPLDGELWMGMGKFQEVMSVCKEFIPGSGWEQVRFVTFDAPLLEEVMANGSINNSIFTKELIGVLDFYKAKGYIKPRPVMAYQETMQWLTENMAPSYKNLMLIPHWELPSTTDASLEALNELLFYELGKGGEGLMLRNPRSFWTPHRANTLLKVKDVRDSEGTVVGYTWGRETDKGSKLLGKMGALIVNWGGKTFELSGFTDKEREMIDPANEAERLQGKRAEQGYSTEFPIGSIVTFKYRELTDAGLPKEARYFRRLGV